jgi:hypothetical protein
VNLKERKLYEEMKKQKEFRFENARRISLDETVKFEKAIEIKLKVKRAARGRPPKSSTEMTNQRHR